MADNNLTTNVVINARTGSGWSKAGATLTEMGVLVEGISRRLREFGQESTQVYREYEKSMADAEVALSTSYGRNSQALRSVMEQLDDMATEWAATTIFHTDDVANAVSEAAHAGWDLEKIMTGLPEAMELAQAGSLDLSTALDYIVKSTYAAGVEFEDLSHFTDIWTYAANRSATTVGEVGEAMLRMGGTMRFAASEEELMTLIGIMANSGYVGSEAGTLIRNSMMRLIVPTDKANKALAEMGATAEEVEEIVGDEHILAAYRALEEHGFRGLYDESGRMRPILEVYSEMAAVLGSMAGGVENISNNQDALDILGAIFPTRSITGALNIINAAANGYDGLFEALQSGAAEGYGAYAAETMMDTLNGSILTFQSKLERLKQLVGEELTPTIERWADAGGRFVDWIANLDESKFSAVVSGLTTIAFAGPALLGAGAAMRLIGLFTTPLGAAVGGITAATALVVSLTDLAQSHFAEQFGTMALDGEMMAGWLGGLSEEFSASRAAVESFSGALDAAVESYSKASATLSSKLTSAMITGARLTEDDYKQLEALADEMIDATFDAVGARASESVSYWDMLFGGDEDNPYLQELVAAATAQAEDSLADVRAIGDKMREALLEAFDDGVLTPDELEKIQGFIREYNDAVAQASREDEQRRQRAALNATLHRAQMAGIREARRYASEIEAQRDAMLEEAYAEFLDEYYRLDGNENVSPETMAAAEEAWLAYRAEKTQRYDNALTRLSYYMDGAVGFKLGDYSIAQARATLATSTASGGGAESYLSEIERLLTLNLPNMTSTDEYRAAYESMAKTDLSLLSEMIDALGAVYDLSAVNAAYGGDPTGGALGGEIAVARLLGMTDAEAEAFRLPAGSDMTGLEEELANFKGAVTATVDGDTAPLREQIAALNGTTVSVNVAGSYGLFSGFGVKQYAEGGRADEPSIFGEAGAEWAIPEEHTERTAALLDAARAASGFSWAELLARNGGLNAEGGRSATTIVYSPVIHAADARGVEEALRADKQRLEDWWEEHMRRERAEVYA